MINDGCSGPTLTWTNAFIAITRWNAANNWYQLRSNVLAIDQSFRQRWCDSRRDECHIAIDRRRAHRQRNPGFDSFVFFCHDLNYHMHRISYADDRSSGVPRESNPVAIVPYNTNDCVPARHRINRTSHTKIDLSTKISSRHQQLLIMMTLLRHEAIIRILIVQSRANTNLSNWIELSIDIDINQYIKQIRISCRSASLRYPCVFFVPFCLSLLVHDLRVNNGAQYRRIQPRYILNSQIDFLLANYQ